MQKDLKDWFDRRGNSWIAPTSKATKEILDLMAQMTPDDINKIVWRACDTFRGTIDPAQYKDYVLVMLFLKYLTDLRNDKR